MPDSSLPVVVVIGAGFAGINLIKKLRNKPVQIILLDKNNFHQFQPLLYQVAIAGLEPDSIVSPIRKLFQGYKNLAFRMAEVLKIEQENQRIVTNIGWLPYDYLVIATGSTSNYYGLNQIEKNSVGLKDIRDALDIRSWVLQNLEEAVITCNLKEKDALTNFVIVGGGPAGVELAGALAEFKRYLLHKDYPEIAKEWMKIYLLEAADRLLPVMSEKSSTHAFEVLKRLDVEVLLNTALKNYDGNTVALGSGDTISAKTLIWTAGVQGNYPSGLTDSDIVKGNRLKVDTYNQVEGFKNIFAIGDVAAMISEEYPNGHPMLAPVAIQQGNLLAKNLIHLVAKGNLQKPFQYRDKGSMATIGKNRAVAEFGKTKLTGWLAWVMWSTVHLFSITGFKNRLMVGINWMIRYLTYEKANRLIIRRFENKGGTNQLENGKDNSLKQTLKQNIN
jgi:NADH dehydrogenase